MKLPIYQINSFASGPFSGNPAAVCPLPSWIEDDLLQRIAADTQLTTAFFVGKDGEKVHGKANLPGKPDNKPFEFVR